MMKAQQYDHRWLVKQLRHPLQPNVFALRDSGDWPTFERQMRQAFAHHPSLMEEASIKTAKALFETFADAKEYGSIIQPEISLEELNMLENTLDEMAQKADLMDFVAQADAISLMETLKPLIRQCRGLVQKYHVSVTNPPYMSDPSMSQSLNDFIRLHYLDCKTDIYSVFIKRCVELVAINGFSAIVTMHSWMFLTTFENLRKDMVAHYNFVSLNHLGMEAFEGIIGKVVSTVAFVRRNQFIPSYVSSSVRLVKYYDSLRYYKEEAFFLPENRYYSVQDKYKSIDGWPIAYWVSDQIIDAFERGERIGTLALPRQGLATGDNERFLRAWYEVSFLDIGLGCTTTEVFHNSGYKYAPYNKGGDFRKWYGNRELVIRFDKPNYDILSAQGNHLPSRQLYFRESLTWSALTSGSFSGRYCEPGFVFDTKGSSCFFDSQQEFQMQYLLLFRQH